MGEKPETSSCQHRLLAQGSAAQIQCCVDCGTVSVLLGAVTLRFHPAALESLWSTIGEALAQLHLDANNDVVCILPRAHGPYGRA